MWCRNCRKVGKINATKIIKYMYIRSPIAAGTFYPDNPQELKQMVELFIRQSSVRKLEDLPKGLIVPHAGYVYSGIVAASAYKVIQDKEFSTVILLGPSHHFVFPDFVFSPPGYWETPLGRVKTLSLSDFPSVVYPELFQQSARIHQPEHCLEVQLPFLQVIKKEFKIFPLLVGDIDIEKGSRALLSLLRNPDSLLIVSSDLSHYLNFEDARRVDKVTLDAILAKDRQRFEQFGEACGKTAISLLLEIAVQHNWRPVLLRAMNSGETAGGKEQVVGYASVVFIK